MSVNRPSTPLRGVATAAVVAGVGTLAVAAWWAFGVADDALPVSAAAGQSLAVDGAGPQDDARSHVIAAFPAIEPLDLAVFDAPIWIAPPEPPAPPAVVVETKPAPPSPPPPLKLQLIGISRRDVPATDSTQPLTVYRAIVYDPDSDTLLTLETGQSLASGRSVERVDAAGVALRDGVHVRTLALREPDPMLDDLLKRSRGHSERKGSER